MRLNKISYYKRSNPYRDIILVMTSICIISAVYRYEIEISEIIALKLFLSSVILYPLLMILSGSYKKRSNNSFRKRFIRMLSANAFFAAGLYIILFSNIYKPEKVSFTISVFLLNIALLCITELNYKLLLSYLKKDRIYRRKVLVIGDYKYIRKFRLYIYKRKDLLIDIVGYIILDGHKENRSLNRLGNINNLSNIINEYVIDEVIFTIPINKMPSLMCRVRECQLRGITVNVITEFYHSADKNLEIGKIGCLPVITYHSISIDEKKLIFKRIIDILFSIIGLVVTFFLTIILAPIILFDSKGPIFFHQYRVGQNGRKFKCYKFRTMCCNAEEKKKELLSQNEMKGAIFKIRNDPRVTKTGHILRRLSIDEFPQFWNVLIGDMSLVGTRPPTLDEVDQYKNYHMRRLSFKPGLTGNWQVNGRGKVIDFENVVKLDVDYINNWSLLLDLKLILKTVGVIFIKRSAS